MVEFASEEAVNSAAVSSVSVPDEVTKVDVLAPLPPFEELQALAEELDIPKEITVRSRMISRGQFRDRLTEEARWGVVRQCGAVAYREYLKWGYSLTPDEAWWYTWLAYPPLQSPEDRCRCGRVAEEHFPYGCAPIEADLACQKPRRGANKERHKLPKKVHAPAPAEAGFQLYDRKDIAEAQKGSSRGTVKWVAEHLRFEVDISEAPNQAAWSLLLWARDNQDAFWQMFKSTIEKDQDVRDPLKDDGGEVLNLLGALQKEGFKMDQKEGVDL